jgi:hypothetical protein
VPPTLAVSVTLNVIFTFVFGQRSLTGAGLTEITGIALIDNWALLVLLPGLSDTPPPCDKFNVLVPVPPGALPITGTSIFASPWPWGMAVVFFPIKTWAPLLYVHVKKPETKLAGPLYIYGLITPGNVGKSKKAVTVFIGMIQEGLEPKLTIENLKLNFWPIQPLDAGAVFVSFTSATPVVAISHWAFEIVKTKLSNRVKNTTLITVILINTY